MLIFCVNEWNLLLTQGFVIVRIVSCESNVIAGEMLSSADLLDWLGCNVVSYVLGSCRSFGVHYVLLCEIKCCGPIVWTGALLIESFVDC